MHRLYIELGELLYKGLTLALTLTPLCAYERQDQCLGRGRLSLVQEKGRALAWATDSVWGQGRACPQCARVKPTTTPF